MQTPPAPNRGTSLKSNQEGYAARLAFGQPEPQQIVSHFL
jgi:hypothetical protein